MRAAAAHVDKETSVLGVTLLTSLNAEAVRAVGWKGGIHETVECLSALSRKSGLAGVVCSPHEAAKERSAWGAAAEIVTPGIRDPKDESDDQARSKRASEAIGAGASRIVVGRPILKSDNPEAALEVILSG